MPDPILDDVQSLLEKEFGDKRILEQIQRAAQNNEVISNFERNYVKKLAEKHLGRKPPVEKKPEEQKQVITNIPPPHTPQIKHQPVQTWSEPPKVTKSGSKNNKMILGVGLAVLAVIIIGAISLSDVSEITSPNLQNNPTQITSASFSIKTDLESYNKGDIISITGNLKTSNQVKLSIKNPNGDLVWSEEVNVKSGGQFSTLTFAGGSGWEQKGTFTIIAESSLEQATNSFLFNR